MLHVVVTHSDNLNAKHVLHSYKLYWIGIFDWNVNLSPFAMLCKCGDFGQICIKQQKEINIVFIAIAIIHGNFY